MTLRGIIVTTALLASASIAHAADYRAATWNPRTHPNAAIGYVDWAKAVQAATGGSVTFEVFTDAVLLPPNATLQGLSDGVADVGFVYTPMTPSQSQRANVLVELMFTAEDSMAAELAWSEMNFTNDALIAEWNKNGTVFGGGFGSTTFNFICAKDVDSAEDLRGLKVRTSFASQTDYVTGLGGIPVSVPMTDAYSGLQRGSLDCVVTGLESLDQGFRLGEVAKSVYRLPMGVAAGGMWVYNAAFWRTLTPDNRKLLLDVSAAQSIHAHYALDKHVETGIVSSKNRGVSIVVPDAAALMALKAYHEGFIDRHVAKAKQAGIDDADSLVRDFLAAYEKWKGLLAGVDRSNADEVIGLAKTHIYGRVDASKYGL